MTEADVRDLIETCGCESVVIFFDPAYADVFVGVTDDDLAVYDYNVLQSINTTYTKGVGNVIHAGNKTGVWVRSW